MQVMTSVPAVPMRALRLSLVLLTMATCTIACSTDGGPPTVIVSNEIIASVATAALGDDAAIQIRPDAADPVDAGLLDQLAPIPFGEGPQWLGTPPPSATAPGIGSPDPSFWLDPDRLTQAARWIAARVDLDAAAQQRTDERLATWRETMLIADEQVQGELLDLPPERRIVRTNSSHLGYFAQRYGLQIAPGPDPGPLGDLDLGGLGLSGSSTATLDGLIVELGRRLASSQG
jgi:ABC-type Zn uptake system ZnuABC Zn-binding protein ZnuA